MFDIDFLCAYVTYASMKIFFIRFIELLSMVVEINEMKWMRGIPCRCQSVKLSVDQEDFSCDVSKEKLSDKTIVYRNTWLGN